jgi:hypothetical protein
LSLWQNVAAGFSLRLHRLESLCHRGFIELSEKSFSLSMNFVRGSFGNLYNQSSAAVAAAVIHTYGTIMAKLAGQPPREPSA